MTPQTITLKNLKPFYGAAPAVKPVSMAFEARQITAIIGPSGCGKSTVLRCLNRLHETIEGASAQGEVLLGDENIYAPGIDPTLVRRRIGMVFQQPIALRTRSIFENVAVGLRLAGMRDRRQLAERVERSLQAAALWDEVKDKLDHSGLALSGGQQQRLSIARTLAVEPEVILMDEPCSALDPIATLKIEELMDSLRKLYTVIIVTHNMHQAARISDTTAVFTVEREAARALGELVECGPTAQVFTRPSDPRAEEYISGRVG
ncbi:MAG TPA: phosphate ABC transporter ATP-binding protein PstB [Kouleothrix sp.]|uniref:phosphate ABC transporter ATP-binding protein PstB n=1 Tax=Kouleothrix sp. TaxID=2779161 RepID=UPI002CB5A64E|nr:phosphate ABC transporter ATP-binding protein PstB [Kouleothrix sp.]HRC74369.1 phosphate ABC transporter ATP-binding protein PstB [Kouleothrix sp.]